MLLRDLGRDEVEELVEFRSLERARRRRQAALRVLVGEVGRDADRFGQEGRTSTSSVSRDIEQWIDRGDVFTVRRRLAENVNVNSSRFRRSSLAMIWTACEQVGSAM